MTEEEKSAKAVLDAYREKGLKISVAESCTGGLVAANLTAFAGSSDVFERGFVTYSNEAKEQLLGVPKHLIEEQGAVSADVAEAMAAGSLKGSLSDVAVSVTGIAGPGGATGLKPVGLVYFGLARRGAQPQHFKEVFSGDRTDVRRAATTKALSLFLFALEVSG